MLAAQGLKRCGDCKEVLPHADFHKNTRTWDKLMSYCRACDSKRSAAYYEANCDKVLERQREYDSTRREADPLWNRIHRGAVRARKAGCEVIPFTSDELLAYWESNGIAADKCVYCGGEFEHTDHAIPLSRGGSHSVDNVVPACSKCNKAKGNRTAEEYLSEFMNQEESELVSA